MKKTFIQVTSAQKELLRLLEHKEAPDYYESLKMVQFKLNDLVLNYCNFNFLSNIS